MIISKTTGYGIRALTYLAARTAETPCPLQEIVDHEQIPRIFLQKILGSLRRRRLLRSARGIHGGYELGRPADAITVWEIFCLLEPDPYLDGCILGCSHCTTDAGCGLHGAWKSVRRELVTAFQNTTIAELAAHRRNGHAQNENGIPAPSNGHPGIHSSIITRGDSHS
jgi:Rrf2 family protein